MSTQATEILNTRKQAAQLFGMQVPFTSKAPGASRIPSIIPGDGSSGYFPKDKLTPGYTPSGSKLQTPPLSSPDLQASIPQSARDTKSKSLAVKNQTTKAMQAYKGVANAQPSAPSAPAAPLVGPTPEARVRNALPSQPLPRDTQNLIRQMTQKRPTTIGSRTTEIGAPKVAQYLALAVLRGRTVA